MKGKITFITGSTDGIGKQTALELARMGATVLLHGRDPARGQAVLEAIRKATGNESLDLFIADLASLKQVRQLAAEVQGKYNRLHVLINNAGVVMPRRQLTEDGFETTFAVNHLSHFLLTRLLLGRLKASAPARIINVSSNLHNGGRIDFDNLQGERNFSGYGAYSLSKLANVLFTYELAERLKGAGVTVNALHPGVIATKMLREGFGGGSLEVGAETPVYLAVSPKVQDITGKYFVRKRIEESAAVTYDQKLRQKLWEVSERLSGLV